MSKQGHSHYFHLHARAPPTEVPGWVDERMPSVYPDAPRLLPVCTRSPGTYTLNRLDPGYTIKEHWDIYRRHNGPGHWWQLTTLDRWRAGVHCVGYSLVRRSVRKPRWVERTLLIVYIQLRCHLTDDNQNKSGNLPFQLATWFFATCNSSSSL